MKKTVISKVTLIILAIAMLIGSSVCIVASAEEAECSIKSINIVHSDKVRVLIAVETTVNNPEENVTVEYTIGTSTKTAKFWKYVDIYGDGNEYPVFYTDGIAAKDMGEDVIAKAYVSGTDSSSAKSKNVSVAQYLYQKLYKEGYINAQEPLEVNKKDFYERMLAYGASAQQVLWNNLEDNESNQRTLITDYIPVNISGATVDGNSFLLLKSAGYINPEYLGDDMLIAWNVNYTSGAISVYTPEIYVDSYTSISPIIAKKGYALTFDEDYTSSTVNLSVSGTATNLSFTDIGFKVENTGKTNTGVNGTVSTATVKTDASGNKYLQIHSLGRGDATDRAHAIITPKSTKLTDDANVTVLSFDLRGTGTENAVEIMLRPSSTIYTQFNKVCGIALNGSANEWTNIRLEYYHNESVVQLYVNGVYQRNLVGAGNKISALGDTVYAYIGAYNADGLTSLDFDNVSIYSTTKPYELLPQGTPHHFEFDYPTVENGIVADNGSSDRSYDFGGGVTVSGAGKTWECEAGVQILSGATSKHLRMYGGPRQNSSDRGWILKLGGKTERIPSTSANRTNIEFDMMIETSPTLPSGATGSTGGASLFDFSFYCGSSFVRFDPINQGGNIKLAGNTFAEANAWYTVRFEICHDKNTINVYSKPVGASDWTRTYTIPKSVSLGASGTYGVMQNLSNPFSHLSICGLNSAQSYVISVDNVMVYTAIN